MPNRTVPPSFINSFDLLCSQERSNSPRLDVSSVDIVLRQKNLLKKLHITRLMFYVSFKMQLAEDLGTSGKDLYFKNIFTSLVTPRHVILNFWFAAQKIDSCYFVSQKVGLFHLLMLAMQCSVSPPRDAD